MSAHISYHLHNDIKVRGVASDAHHWLEVTDSADRTTGLVLYFAYQAQAAAMAEALGVLLAAWAAEATEPR